MSSSDKSQDSRLPPSLEIDTGLDNVAFTALDKARLAAILDTAVDAIITIDERGTIESMNTAGERLFGYTLAEVKGNNVSMLMPAPEREKHDQYINRYHQYGERRIIGIGREVLAQRKNGSVFPVDLSVSEMNVGGRRMFTGIIHDVSRRKRYELELLNARELAEKASRAKSEFLSNMSHELRTPLHSIIGFAQLLETEQPALTAHQRESVDVILSSANILLELISELLDLSRIEAGRIPISIEPVPMREVVEASFDAIRPMLTAKNISFSLDLRCGEDGAILADYVRTKQVLLNLLSNAIKYNREGGSVKVIVEPCDAYKTRISVQDTGYGIPADRQSQVFMPFNRLGQEGGSVQGSGIGLVIAKRLVELMGGHIGFESEPDVGTTFWIEFPPTRISSAFASELQRGAFGNGDASEMNTTNVLYIEDNPANLRLMERLILTRANTRLLAAADPMLGLQLARDHVPDLILLDINLPDMDGYEVLTRLRGDPATRDIPIIAVTANAMPRDLERAETSEFDGYVTKPIDVSEFLKLYDSVLARKNKQPGPSSTDA